MSSEIFTLTRWATWSAVEWHVRERLDEFSQPGDLLSLGIALSQVAYALLDEGEGTEPER